MKFEYPIWLMAIAVIVPLIAWAFRCFRKSRTEALKKFAAEHLLQALTASVSPGLRSAKHWLFAIAIVLCLAALARPQAGFRWQEVKRKGIDILFAVDTSKSMLAQDVNPDRLTRAKLAVSDLVEKLEGDRVGLIAFAGSSFLQCPLTLDYDAFRQSLDALDTSIIPKGGTDISAAIKEAGEAFSLGGQNHKILVILTDGEDLESNGIAAAKEAARDGMRIFTVGVGSSAGELIPIPKESGGVDFLKDERGQPVKSKLDDATLRKIAEETGGAYEPLGRQGEGLEAIYQHGLAEIPKQELASRMNKIYIERFQWPLALAILLLVIETMLGERRRLWRNLKSQISDFRLPRVPTATALLMLAVSAWASPQAAERAYREGKYSEAAREYKISAEKQPKKAELQYNVGASTYKAKSYPDAAAAFQKALKTDKVELQQQTFYNLGNAQYRIGQETEKTNPQQTIQTWQQALKSYEAAMQLKKDDADAKYNYEFVKKKLEELQKQQQQNQDQNKDQQKDQQKDQKKDQQQDPQKDDQQQNQDQNKDQKKDEKNKDQNKDQQGQNKDQQKDQGQQDQNKPRDQKKDQQQQAQQQGGQQPKPEEAQDQQKPNPAAGDQQKEKGEPKQPEQGKDESKPEQKKQPGKIGDRKYDKDKKGEEAEPQLLPGQMSKEEAKNLLDSLKGDEKKMPVGVETGQGAGWEDSPKRDW